MIGEEIGARSRNFAIAAICLLVLTAAFNCQAGGGAATVDDSSAAAAAAVFANPERVTITGYSQDAMEPFISLDGKYLFFNNSNDPKVDTNLFYATRVDDLTFQFQGEIGGVNTTALDAVASMDSNNKFYFVSTRSYDQTFSTIYWGDFSNGTVSNVALVPGISKRKAGHVNFDAGISPDGNTLYFVDSFFAGGQPQNASISIAKREGDRFARLKDSAKIMRKINTAALNYAPCPSASGLEFFFTRLDPGGPAIYMASRAATSKPFGTPARIEAITGFVEAPTLSPDQKSLYYHKNENGVFVIYRVTRP
jgi:Tol biopolymer transport system component